MPGRGKIVASETPPSALTPDGAETASAKREIFLDIFLNDSACWRHVPEAVWNYTIGGYQVIKKWLSYREKPLLGRGLTPEEVRYVTEMARRIAALIALQPAIDDNYRIVVRATYPWTIS